LHPTSYRGCWHVVSRCLFTRYRPKSFLVKGVYRPRPFIPHAASLHQGFPHCARFPTAATRRCVGRVSVPLERIILSDPLPVVGLVGFHPTNYLIGRERLLERLAPFGGTPMPVLHNIRYCPEFPLYIPVSKAACSRITSPFATGPEGPVRLACFRHAASVRPEP
jgi:hypothetical protein